MYVVFTPLLAAVILRHKIGRWAWVAVVLATVGLGVLSLHGFSMGTGELLTLASAGLYALHIIGLGAWSTPSNAFGLSALQMVVITVRLRDRRDPRRLHPAERRRRLGRG